MTLAVLLLPIGLPAVLAYRKRVAIPWRLVAALIVGFVAAVGPGARVALATDERGLRALFAGLVVVAAVQAWRRSVAPPDRHSGRSAPGAEPLERPLDRRSRGVPGRALRRRRGNRDDPPPRGGHAARPARGAGRVTGGDAPPVGLPGVLAYAQAKGSLPWAIMLLVAAGFATGAFLGARFAVALRTPVSPAPSDLPGRRGRAHPLDRRSGVSGPRTLPEATGSQGEDGSRLPANRRHALRVPGRGTRRPGALGGDLAPGVLPGVHPVRGRAGRDHRRAARSPARGR